ncbi:MAG: hypothetical protein RLP44_24370 [Aggregatilineales bacterium]
MFKKTDRELIYAHPEWYIGQYWTGSKWDNDALHVFMMVIIREAVDSVSLNQCTRLKVVLEIEDEIIIEDNGLGLPVTPASYVGDPDTPALMRLLNWFIPTGDSTKVLYEDYGFIAYFARVLNVLSSSLRIDTVREGQAYTVSCSNGEIVQPLQKSDNNVLNQGTRIRFIPDSKIFPSPAFDKESLKKSLDELASEFFEVTFEFTAVNDN